MDECWVEYGSPFHGKGPCDALGGAGKGGVNKGLATGDLDCGGDVSDTEIAKCVAEYMKLKKRSPSRTRNASFCIQKETLTPIVFEDAHIL